LLVLIGDTIGRSIMRTGEVPTGIVVAVIGAPYFLYLLAKARA
jgi:iron complex transport system permease protein